MPETDTYREIAARLGMTFKPLNDPQNQWCYFRGTICYRDDAHAIIRDRAAEALRERGYFVIADDGWCMIDDNGWHKLDARAFGGDDYATALLAALDLAGIGAKHE